MVHGIVGAIGPFEVLLIVSYWVVAPLAALAGALLYERWNRRRRPGPPITPG